jgi:hypothetical protein
MRIEVRTERLEAALQRVRQMHPFKGQRTHPPTGTILEEVRESLRTCDHEKLADLAYSFDTSRIMACLEILVIEREDDLADKAHKVLMMRPRDRVTSAGWFKLILHYPHNLLEKFMRANLETKGFGPLAGQTSVSERVPSWFLSKWLSEGVLRDYERSEGYGSLDAYLEGNFIGREEGMFREVWRLLLSRGRARSLHKEDPDRVLVECRKPENAKHLPAFCQHYLNILQSRRKWDERVLRFIERKYGAPSDLDGHVVIETPFWQNVKPDPKKEFKTWLMLQRIEEFFEGERADFWRQYATANRVLDAKEILSGDGFMLDFGKFGVVEFKNLGNAAYIYPAEVFREFWKTADYVSFVGRFKNKHKTIRHRSILGWDGRIIHRANWQHDTSHKIRMLFGK